VERGWTVVQIYQEIHTCAELFERRQMTTLRAAMRQHEFDVLVVHALDRSSRKQTHQGLILSEAEHVEVVWESVTEDIDNSPQEQILRAVIGGMAEMERLKIVERTRRGIRARAESGKLLPGCRPLYGYQWIGDDKATYEQNPETSRVVQRIYKEFLNGDSLRVIGPRLTDDGIMTPGGKRTIWSASTISDIHKNPTYTGVAHAFRYETQSVKGSYTRVAVRSRDEQLPLPEGIVTVEDQSAALSRLDHNRQVSRRNN
jgi:site-specific DNA recombinase